MSNVILETQDLKKYFKTSRGTLHAVDGVNLKINEGQTLGVVGESGCGKSTLGRTILRLLDANGGKVLYRGEDILTYNKQQMKKMHSTMQMIFQDPFTSLNPRLSIEDIILEPMKVTGVVKGRDQQKQKAHELMELCGLPRRYVNTYPHELDGGRRQRVGLARALAVDPEFIVCDEPVSALDVSIQAQILNLLMDLQEHKHLAYMFITHDLCVVRHISDYVVVMYLGQEVEYAPRDELFSNQLHPYTQALLSAIPSTSLSMRGRPKQILTGEVANPIDPAPGCRFVTRCKYATEKCKEPQHLREVSPGHFVRCMLVD
ncbi:oligopeptide/dipeptide ABC transporter ATP-binding protein [Oscillospiraceae bacterium MB08-C2-2]|nr:oligopeptide/dipeptide ABC transporter ATP-binding protein [Oscillospiraceae bacterium MB08-C2-2]